ncbi:MAG: sterol desaturase family protein [Cytophagales bacterium]|nr:sterol desaturase family protein [Cytophagales bacterium]
MTAINLILLTGTFCFMEFTAWFVHKYVMHGFLWYLHQDHHQPKGGIFEKNDAFFLIFAVPSFLLILFGSQNAFDYRFYIGAGILLYGICYFLVHEVLIHQRLPWLQKASGKYFRGLRKAHAAHHKNPNKKGCTCFGMLVVPFKYFRKAH